MTSTLKSFQAEIERISHVKHAEAIKQAKEAHAAAELAKHHGKKVVVKDETEAEVVEVDEGVTLEVSLCCGTISQAIASWRRYRELTIQEAITSEDQEKAGKLQSRLASSLFKGHGEVMIPLGAHPIPKDLYNPQPDTKTQFTGIELSQAQMDEAIKRLKTACESLQAELNELYRTINGEKCYGCWLVRLTPRGVEEIMEVRVAVVGNVDAGKSTTLGVLTRGSLDDGRGKVSPSNPFDWKSVLIAGPSSVIPPSTRDRDRQNVLSWRGDIRFLTNRPTGHPNFTYRRHGPPSSIGDGKEGEIRLGGDL
jgi:hypothetical protein